MPKQKARSVSNVPPAVRALGKEKQPPPDTKSGERAGSERRVLGVVRGRKLSNGDTDRTPRRRLDRSKTAFRPIDFKRDKLDVAAKVIAIEKDPYRSAHIALLRYTDGESRYILCPVGLELGQTVLTGANAGILPGNALPLEKIPVGTVVHNVELRPGKGGQMARSGHAELLSKQNGVAYLGFPSGEIRRVNVECMATVGQIRSAENQEERPSPPQMGGNPAPGHFLAPTHFAHVYSRAVEVIGNADKAMRWLGRPIPALNYATPVSLLRNERGRDAVLDVLGRLEHGVF